MYGPFKYSNTTDVPGAVVQAGLAQLETALEGMDKTAAVYGDSSTFNSSHHNNNNHHHHHHNHHHHQPSPNADDLPAERVLSIAIHISEMPSSKQADALARLPPAVRHKVTALLQEQAVIQGNEPRTADNVISTTEYVVDETPAAAAGARPANGAAAVPKVVVYEDLLGMSGAMSSRAPAAAAAPAPPSAQAVPPATHGRMRSVADMDEFFSGGSASAAADPGRATPSKAAPPAAAGRSTAAGGGLTRVLSGSEGQLGDLLGGGGAAAAGGAGTRAAAAHKSSSMINLGGLEALVGHVDVSGHQ